VTRNDDDDNNNDKNEPRGTFLSLLMDRYNVAWCEILITVIIMNLFKVRGNS
jgi:hypothetical protein